FQKSEIPPRCDTIAAIQNTHDASPCKLTYRRIYSAFGELTKGSPAVESNSSIKSCLCGKSKGTSAPAIPHHKVGQAYYEHLSGDKPDYLVDSVCVMYDKGVS